MCEREEREVWERRWGKGSKRNSGCGGGGRGSGREEGGRCEGGEGGVGAVERGKVGMRNGRPGSGAR